MVDRRSDKILKHIVIIQIISIILYIANPEIETAAIIQPLWTLLYFRNLVVGSAVIIFRVFYIIYPISAVTFPIGSAVTTNTSLAPEYRHAFQQHWAHKAQSTPGCATKREPATSSSISTSCGQLCTFGVQ